MLKQRLLNTALLAGTLSLLTVACQPSPTAPNTNRVNNPSPGIQGGFSKKDWPSNSSGYRPSEIQSLNIQLNYQGSTRNSSGHTVDMSSPTYSGRWWDEPNYDLILSDYVLDASGKQYATKAYIIVRIASMPSVTGETNKDIYSTFTGRLESTDGVHFHFVSSNGYIHGSFAEPDRDLHGNMGSSCQYYERLNMPINLDHNSTLTLHEAEKTFSLHIPFVNAPATTERGLSPWQCSFQCTPGGAYNEQCDGQVQVSGVFDMGGKLIYTAPEQIQLIAEPEIFSTAPDARGSTALYFPNLAPEQLWRLTMPPLRGQPLVIDGFRHSPEYLSPWGSNEWGWSGQKDWKTFSQGDLSWEDYIYYQDGTYSFEIISDRHQKATANVRIDSTKPEFSEPDLKILPDGRRQITITITDPVVNGVRAGIDAQAIHPLTMWASDNRSVDIRVEQVDEFTVKVIGEYFPVTAPTPEPSANPSWSPSTNPSWSPSSNPSSQPSFYPSASPSAQPTSSPSSNEFLAEPRIDVGMSVEDKARNRKEYRKEITFESIGNVDLIVQPELISPVNQDGKFDLTNFHVKSTTTEPWSLTVNAYEAGPPDANGLPTRGSACTWSINGIEPEKNILWDGRCSNGNFVVDGSYEVKLTSVNSSDSAQIQIDNTSPIVQNIDFDLVEDGTYLQFVFQIVDPLVFGVKSGIDKQRVKVLFFDNEITDDIHISDSEVTIKVKAEKSQEFFSALAQNQVKIRLVDNLRNKDVIKGQTKSAKVVGNIADGLVTSNALYEDDSEDFQVSAVSSNKKYRNLLYSGLETYGCDNDVRLSADVLNVKKEDTVIFGIGVAQNGSLKYSDIINSKDNVVYKTQMANKVRYSIPWDKKDGVRVPRNTQVNRQYLPTGRYDEVGISLSIALQKNFCGLFPHCAAPLVRDEDGNIFDPIGVYKSANGKYWGAVVKIQDASFDIVNVEKQIIALNKLRSVTFTNDNFKFGNAYVSNRSKFNHHVARYGTQSAIDTFLSSPKTVQNRQAYYLNFFSAILGNQYSLNDYQNFAHIFEGHGQFIDVNQQGQESGKFASDRVAINSILEAHKDRCRAKNSRVETVPSNSNSSYNGDMYRIINSNHTPVDTGNHVGCGHNRFSNAYNTKKIGYIAEFHSEAIRTVFPATQWILYGASWTGTRVNDCPKYNWIP